MNTCKKSKSLVITLVACLLLSSAFIFTTENTFAATKYVTMSGSNTKGCVPVYKDANGTSQWKSNGFGGVLSKYVYVEYLGTSGDYYKVTWGSSTGYIKRSQGTILETLPTGTKKLMTSKKEKHFTYTNYLASNTYVTPFSGTSISRIKWATYCTDPQNCSDPDQWIVPGSANLSDF
ncbi:hypothetical protein [Senimuribacter intestinalis]|uniref:hypothetical protein n=1 Tax=Senimuribacter intestinalis TaxID=2941507 RepID=UPI002040F2F7|nr:hypothetical protein [Senimuribacter intestinalis]